MSSFLFPDQIGARRVRRCGAVLAVADGTDARTIGERRAWTRLGARRAYRELQRRVVDYRTTDVLTRRDADTDRSLIAARVEGGMIVEQFAVPMPDVGGEPDGVREPRRPLPSTGEAGAAVDPRDG